MWLFNLPVVQILLLSGYVRDGYVYTMRYSYTACLDASLSFFFFATKNNSGFFKHIRICVVLITCILLI